MKIIKKFSASLLALLLLMSLCACGQSEVFERTETIPESVQQEVTSPEDADEPPEDVGNQGEPETSEVLPLDEDGTYTTKEDVALYIYLYGHLPGNFITKKEAEKLGWSGGSLEPYAPGMLIRCRPRSTLLTCTPKRELKRRLASVCPAHCESLGMSNDPI